MAAAWRPGTFRAAHFRRHGQEWLRPRIRTADIRPDPRLRRIRLSRIACHELRAIGVGLELAQALSPGGVHVRVVEFAADGLLSAIAIDPGCATARHTRTAGRRDDQYLGLHT